MIISKTPLRCSFFGGGTDFNTYYQNSRFGYGSVISTTINMYVYITVNRNFDNKIRLCYFGNELVDNIDEVKHNIIRETLKHMNIKTGIEVFYSADIPLSNAGIGLASSSALTVGLLNALHAYKGEHVTPEQLAREACIIEINKNGQRIGIQDQYAVAYGGFNRFYFNRDGTVSVSPIICDLCTLRALQENLLLFFTGAGRDSRTIMSEQTQTITDKMYIYDNLIESVERTQKYLNVRELDNWGLELDKAWQEKKKFASGISNVNIDAMYDKARNAGALGGKILGAGGGGFLLLYGPQRCHKAITKALNGYRKMNFVFEPQGSRIIFSDSVGS